MCLPQQPAVQKFLGLFVYRTGQNDRQKQNKYILLALTVYAQKKTQIKKKKRKT